MHAILRLSYLCFNGCVLGHYDHVLNVNFNDCDANGLNDRVSDYDFYFFHAYPHDHACNFLHVSACSIFVSNFYERIFVSFHAHDHAYILLYVNVCFDVCVSSYFNACIINLIYECEHVSYFYLNDFTILFYLRLFYDHACIMVHVNVF